MVDSTQLPNIDINAIGTDLNNKMDRDCLNYSETGYNFMAGAGMPSDTYINLTLGSSGTRYTAPANGYFYCFYRAPYDNSFTNHTKNMLYVSGVFGNNQTQQPHSYLIPVKKGDVVSCFLNATPTEVTFKFIYAQGSASEAN